MTDKTDKLLEENFDELPLVEDRLWVYKQVSAGTPLDVGDRYYTVSQGAEFKVFGARGSGNNGEARSDKHVGGDVEKEWDEKNARWDFYVPDLEETKKWREEVIEAKTHYIDAEDPDGTLIVYRPSKVGEDADVMVAHGGKVYFADKRDNKDKNWREKHVGNKFGWFDQLRASKLHKFYVRADDEDQWYLNPDPVEPVNDSVETVGYGLVKVLNDLNNRLSELETTESDRQ